MQPSTNAPRRTLLLTGASRGIGHATVIRFSSAGWRVLTCSRHPFPEDCPWDAGPEDHVQVDLADHADTTRAILMGAKKFTWKTWLQVSMSVSMVPMRAPPAPFGEIAALLTSACNSPPSRRSRISEIARVVSAWLARSTWT